MKYIQQVYEIFNGVKQYNNNIITILYLYNPTKSIKTS